MVGIEPRALPILKTRAVPLSNIPRPQTFYNFPKVIGKVNVTVRLCIELVCPDSVLLDLDAKPQHCAFPHAPWVLLLQSADCLYFYTGIEAHKCDEISQCTSEYCSFISKQYNL